MNIEKLKNIWIKIEYRHAAMMKDGVLRSILYAPSIAKKGYVYLKFENFDIDSKFIKIYPKECIVKSNIIFIVNEQFFIHRNFKHKIISARSLKKIQRKFIRETI